jgi:2',3'-cyclic-nucleotide 2'-phosphodiesterase (5'-nucleotidase family)
VLCFRALKQDQLILAGLFVVALIFFFIWGVFPSWFGGLTRQSTLALDPIQAPPKEKTFIILAINDVYRIEGLNDGKYGGLAKVRSLRAELEQKYPDLLLLHAGDMLFPSLLSKKYKGEQMIDMLNLLDNDSKAPDNRMLVTFGNHEFDDRKLDDARTLKMRVEESQFRWLGSNIEFASGSDGRPLVEANNLVDSVIQESGGIKVGVFSLTTDDTRPEYVAEFAEPEITARRMTAQLRQQGAEVVVALTHLPIDEDIAVLRKLGADGPDLIIGGHEHNNLIVSRRTPPSP